MNKQEQFDIMVNHLLKQNARSETQGGDEGDPICLYRHSDGRKCAVGVLIPDELYEAEMEGNNPRQLLHLYPELCAYIDKDLAGYLQNTHDEYYPDEWPEQLRNAAAHFQLTYNGER